MVGGEVEWRSGNHPILSVDQSRHIFRDVVSGLDYCKKKKKKKIALIPCSKLPVCSALSWYHP